MDAPAPPRGALKAVFLDAGGTLIHLDWAFLAETLGHVGIARSRAELEDAFSAARARLGALLRERPSTTDKERAAVLWHTMLERAGCADGLRLEVERRVRAREDEGRLWSHVEPGTVETLRALREGGLILGVVSNSDGRVDRFLERAGLTEHVDFVLDSGRVGFEKPDPRIFDVACRRAGVAPEETVHVGDVYDIDVVGARAAGVAAILLDAAGALDDVDCPAIRAFPELPGLLLSPSPAV